MSSSNSDKPAMLISHKDQMDSAGNCSLCCDGVMNEADHSIFYYAAPGQCVRTASRSHYEVWMRGGSLSASYTYSTNNDTITFGDTTTVWAPGVIPPNGGGSSLGETCVAGVTQGFGSAAMKSITYGIIPFLKIGSNQFEYLQYVSAEGATSSNWYDPNWDHFQIYNYGGYECDNCDPFGTANVNITWNGGGLAAPSAGPVCFTWFGTNSHSHSCNLNIQFTPNQP